MLIKKILKKIYHILKYNFIDKPSLIIDNYKQSIGNDKYDKVLNTGERYDPEIGEMIKWFDPCHVSRYGFAKKYLRKEDTVLDIACGTGYGTKILSSYCKSVTGVDISYEAIQYAKLKYRNRKSEFIVSDFFENKIIADIVVSFETIEHISCHNLTDVIRQLLKYCNNIIIGSVPYKEYTNNNKHHFSFNIDEESFEFLHNVGELRFYYQIPDGDIFLEKPVENEIQNLIFVFKKSVIPNRSN
jgi:2-polyprenyl-3-methyl-5-hydroxy-6-metoxy-1,4-benzoquinol methylase